MRCLGVAASSPALLLPWGSRDPSPLLSQPPHSGVVLGPSSAAPQASPSQSPPQGGPRTPCWGTHLPLYYDTPCSVSRPIPLAVLVKVCLHFWCPLEKCALPGQDYVYSSPVNAGARRVMRKWRPRENQRDRVS